MKKLLLATLGATAIFAAGLGFNATTASADTRVTVKSGDSVWQIAKDNNSTINAIENANSISNHMIYVGEVLTIPDSTTSSTAYSSQSATVNSSANYSNSQSTTGTGSTTGSTSSTSSYTPSTTTSSSSTTSSTTSSSSSNAAAKAWIANKESGGSYTATNGSYIGKYQLSSSYLNGDYSAANQEKVANEYVSSRYGSWTAAKAFWEANGWY